MRGLDEFSDEYNLAALVKVEPSGKRFRMWTNPRRSAAYVDPLFESYTVALVSRIAPSLRCFIDVGAHHGYYSLLVASLAPECRILAFEPVAQNFEVLRKNLEENSVSQGEAHCRALTDRAQVKGFYVSSASDNGGFVPHPATPTKETIRVDAVRLDDYRGRIPSGPTLIKIDTEGHEIEVLRGMREVFQTIEDLSLVVEFNPALLRLAGHQPEELLNVLREAGFDPYLLSDAPQRYYHLADAAPWEDFLGQPGLANLMCLRRQKSLNVVLFSHTAQLGGAERSLLELVEYMTARQVMCTIFVPSPGPLADLLRGAGAAVVQGDYTWWCDSRPVPAEEQSQRLGKSLRWLLEAQPLLQRIDPDVVVTNSTVIPWGALAAALIHRPHAWIVPEFGRLDHQFEYFSPFIHVPKFIVESSNFILTRSGAVRDVLFRDLQPKRIEVVYPSPSVSLGESRDAAPHGFHRPGAVRLVIHGLLAPSKGQEDAILAVRELVRRRGKDVDLLIVGARPKPEYFAWLQDLVEREKLQEYIRFMDFRADVLTFVKQADIVLVCSRMEALGRATCEAMLLKKPVVATRTGGTVELVRDGVNGLLYEPGDYVGLANAIAELCEHPRRRIELGRSGYEFVRQVLSPEATNGRALQILASLKGEGNPLSAPSSLITFQLFGAAIGEVTEQLEALRGRLAETDDEIESLYLALRRRDALPGRLRGLVRSVVHPFRTYRLIRDIRVIKSSRALDVAFYLSRYRDVRLRGCDATRHFCEYGWKEGRNPSPVFETAFYLERNPDVAAAGVNPLVHFVRYGRQEGRLPSKEALGSPSGEDGAPSARRSAAADDRRPAQAPPEATHRGPSSSVVNPLRPAMTPWGPGSQLRPPIGLLSRAAIALFTLPATFFYCEGLRSWARAIAGGQSFFRDVLDQPDQCRTRLGKVPLLLRVLVSALLSAALRIRKNGGVLPSLHNTRLVLRNEGLRGLRARLTEFVPLGEANAASTSFVSPAGENRPRILVIDWRIPMADVSAGERATVGILGDLCAIGFDVVFVPKNMEPAPEYEQELRRLGVTVVTTALGYHSPVQYLNEQGQTFAAFYLIRVDVAEAVLDTIRKVAPSGIVLFHLPDVYFLREGREAELKDDPKLRAKAEATRERELKIIRQVDRTVIVSPAELPVLRQFVPDVPISVFPVLYAPVVTRPAPLEARQDMIFLGGYEHPPNVDAVSWFVAEIWPLVHADLPHAVFHIVGSKAPQAVLDLASVPGVQVDGYVRDLEALLSSMRVGVAPVRYGAGIKGKVAMTMGAGIPCVCTSIAAEGLGVDDGIHTRIADEPRAFARAVVQLYTDPELWRRLSSEGRELIRRRFGPEANRATLLKVLDEADLLPVPLFIDHCKTLPPRPVPCPAEGEAVDVSVIIPVFNQWELTRGCLNSILEVCAADEIRYEIILADDGSTDETIHAAEHYPGLRVVKTPRNVGFLRNCNNAARHARGKHILLLNNDTVVLPGWMSALYQLMEQDESAAIVGSKLLYPDGTIQEAGGVLWDDATAHNFGRGKPRTAAECNYVREVDYLSGASVLVRKTFWDRVGGFDERYETAYCEDSDLAMSARAGGKRVVYEPRSEVVHFENQTYAEQAPTHNSALQQRNIARLREKWRKVLTTQHRSVGSPYHLGVSTAERSPSPSARVRRGRGRLNVLYFSPFPSHPGNHGNQATIRNFGRLFQSMGHKVHFALLQSDLFSPDDVEDMREYWDALDVLPNKIPMLADGNPIRFDGWYEEGLGERIACLCARYDIDVVFCSYVFQSKLLEFVPAHVLKVIDTHDKMGNRYEMLRANGQPLEFFSCTPEQEGAYLRRADIVVARREEEARYFDSVTGRTTAIVIPHLEDPHFAPRAFSGLHNVGIVASPNRINLGAVRECLAAIDRRLRSEDCPFTLNVAGHVEEMVPGLPSREAEVFGRPWVRMRGFVPDIAGFYAEMDLIVSPATMGTGINVKTVQAMAFGMPLLTTVVGSRGIVTGDPLHSHVDLDALADSLLALTSRPDELERLAALSRTWYTSFYESGLVAMRGMFAHPKLQGRGLSS